MPLTIWWFSRQCLTHFLIWQPMPMTISWFYSPLLWWSISLTVPHCGRPYSIQPIGFTIHWYNSPFFTFNFFNSSFDSPILESCPFIGSPFSLLLLWQSMTWAVHASFRLSVHPLGSLFILSPCFTVHSLDRPFLMLYYTQLWNF